MRGANGALGARGLLVASMLSGSSLLACSTVDHGPIDECRDDIDCGTGSVCSFAQGNICVPEVLPPQTALGFDIGEGEVRIELTGCDPEVTRELGGSELRVQKHASLVRDYQLRASESRTITSCDECEATCDESALTCTTPADAELDLSMDSRLGLELLDDHAPAKSYVVTPDLPEGELPVPVAFTWPTYESIVDPAARSALILEVTPPADTPPRSRYLRAIAADAPDEIDSAALDRCERAIIGPESTVRTYGGIPIAGASVEFTYNEPIASPVTVIGNGAACGFGTECPPGWACNSGSCGLDLTGVVAGSAVSRDDPPGSLPPAYLYTYCEDVAAGEDLVRGLSVRVTPPEDSGLPTMIYQLSQTFPYPPAPGTLTEINLQEANVPNVNALCLPDWQPPFSVAFSVNGSPITLTETALGTYTCCSTECLPSPEPGVEPTPPPQDEACGDFAKASFETKWFNDDPQEWAFAGCIPTGVNPGTFVRSVNDVQECAPEGCSVMLTSGEIDELTFSYTVSIEQRDGSVFRSQRYNALVTAETENLTFALEPRVLLRGQVVCISDNCSAQSAVVAAQRLRTDIADADAIGPFEFEARVDATGTFVMPVDPGVYVVTAYPEVGQAGGPAPYQVVDLREDSELIDDVDGVPNATLADPLELDEGVLVRVQLRDFAVSTRVTPYDIGSWKYQDDFPEDLDLNDPSTCLSSSIPRQCRIRRLRPANTPISLLLSGEFQFTTRDRGGQCPG
jgi:hypothetical protein